MGLHLGHGLDGASVRLKADRLTTHGVVVGMTGSGKTGLCLVLLEELVSAGVPIICIDPKGDLGNLGLLFPQLRAEDFAPWVGREDPAEVAAQWGGGLLSAGITADRVSALRSKMDFRVFTPGSTAGIGVDLLSLLAAPPEAVVADVEARTETVSAAVSGLMGLVGRKVAATQDPAHVVLSQLLDHAWTRGESPDLGSLVLGLVDPPFEKVGIFPLETFFPRDARMKLAMAFNTLIAAPSFGAWRQGGSLQPETLLRQGAETPVSVFNVAHLDEAGRHFFVSLLLSRLLAWTRRQPGSSDLRGLLFFDEVAGYLPPHPHNPASKAPLLTLMKQARAVGFGVVLSTQNPVDLDYKALSNAGTWAIGRLTTAQDRDRLLKGIQADDLDATVAGLQKRQFVLHQAGRGAPQVFGTRHAMCWLRGPLTSVEVGRLNDMWSASGPESARGPAPAVERDEGVRTVPPGLAGAARRFVRSPFAARMKDAFTDAAELGRADGKIMHRPALWVRLELRFDETRRDYLRDETIDRVWFPLEDGLPDAHVDLEFDADDLAAEPAAGAVFCDLPTWMDERTELDDLAELVEEDVYRDERRGQFTCRALKLWGRGEEDRDAFEARCRAEVEARVDAQAEKLRGRFEARAERLQRALDDKRARLAEQQGVTRSRQLEEAVNLGTTILSFFGGRRRSLTTAVSKRRQSSRAAARADRLEDEIAALEADAEALEHELADALAAIREEEEAALDDIREEDVGLERSDIRLAEFGVIWVPVTRALPGGAA